MVALAPVSHTHLERMSCLRVPVLQPPGHRPPVTKDRLGKGHTMHLPTVDWIGRSWECDPRQLGYLFSRGPEALFHVKRVSTPDMFWKEYGIDRTGEGWVLGRYKGKPGAVKEGQGRIIWTPLENSQIPSRLEGAVASVSSNFGAERGMENIVACRGDRGDSRDVIVTHISDPADRQLIVINPNDWQENHPERRETIEFLDKLDLVDIEKTEAIIEGDMVAKLRVYSSNIIDIHTGGRYYHDIDISFLNIRAKDAYYNPEDGKFSIRLITPSEREDFECLERERVVMFYNRSTKRLERATVRGFRDEEGKSHIRINPTATEELGSRVIQSRHLDSGAIQITITEGEQVKTVVCRQEYELRDYDLFKSYDGDTQNALLRVFQNSQSVTLSGKSAREIRKSEVYQQQGKNVKKAINEILLKTLETDNFSIDRVKKIRPRYVIQFYNYRESRLENVLDKPLEKDESVVVTKVLSSARVVHLDKSNGRERGAEEVVPLNFDPSDGDPMNYDLLEYDERNGEMLYRPHAIFSTRFLNPIATAIAPQFLIDPYVMGTEIMAAVWPKVDQLGFFGPLMLAAMAFPHGAIFNDPKNNPWFVRSYATLSHSLFDGKSDAGMLYFALTGNRRLKGRHELVGAAMVTGPNTHSTNPVREGRLFYSRIPGRKPFQNMTAMPGFYITVIEDAQISYMEARMFGLKTVTTVLPLALGGGLENYQTALSVQRAMRWNAGISIYLLDGAEIMWRDFTRGTGLYHRYYNATRKIWGAVRPEGLVAPDGTPVNRALDPKVPTPKAFKLNEKREWFNVGTWYFVGAAKVVLAISVAVLVASSMALLSGSLLPLPVIGSLFLFACLGSTIFGWPFWRAQMMKVATDPRTIMSFYPKHLFWNDLAYDTMTRSSLDNERMALGRFRISRRDAGNRILPNDKRKAFWIGFVAPTVAGAVFIGTAIGVTMALGIIPAAISSFPFLVGILASRLLSRVVQKLLPNPGKQSAGRAFVHSLVRNLPVIAGIIGTILIAPSLAVFTIPLVTVIMAGGWALYGGVNIYNEFCIYHKEQKEVCDLNTPNPLPGMIPRHKADTWRNTLRQVFGLKSALYEPSEFTSHNNPEVSSYALWDRIEGRRLADALGDNPKFEALEHFLIDNSLLAVNGSVSRYYEGRFSLEAVLTEKRINAAEFKDRYGVSVEDLHEAMVSCKGIREGLLSQNNEDPLVNLNALIAGEGERIMVDLYHELTPASLSGLEEKIGSLWNPLSLRHYLTRRGRIAILLARTRKDRARLAKLPRSQRLAETLEAEQYDRITELNRIVLNERFPEYSPGRKG